MDKYFSQPIPILALIFNGLSICVAFNLLWMKRKDAAIFSVSRLRALFFLTALNNVFSQLTNVVVFVIQQSPPDSVYLQGLIWGTLHLIFFYLAMIFLSFSCIERFVKLTMLESKVTSVVLKAVSAVLGGASFVIAMMNISTVFYLTLTAFFDLVFGLFAAWTLVLELTLNLLMIRRTVAKARRASTISPSSTAYGVEKLKRRLLVLYCILIALAAFSVSIFIASTFCFQGWFSLVLHVCTSIAGLYIFFCMILFDLYVEGVSSFSKAGAALKKNYAKGKQTMETRINNHITILSSVDPYSASINFEADGVTPLHVINRGGREGEGSNLANLLFADSINVVV